MVVCMKCKQRFDTNLVQAVKYNKTRYAHQKCYPEGELYPMEKDIVDEDLVKLKEYIDTLFQNQVNWGLINRQIKQFKEVNGYSYNGILKSLIYAYEVKKIDKTKARGIGLVSYYYKDAFNYYYSIWEANQKNSNKIVTNYVPEEKVISIKAPKKAVRKRKLFTFLDEEEINGI